jgi:hypothetical protein
MSDRRESGSKGNADLQGITPEWLEQRAQAMVGAAQFLQDEYLMAVDRHNASFKITNLINGWSNGGKMIDHEPDGGTLIMTLDSDIYIDKYGNQLKENYKDGKNISAAVSFIDGASVKQTGHKVDVNFPDGNELTSIRNVGEFVQIGSERFMKKSPFAKWKVQEPL